MNKSSKLFSFRTNKLWKKILACLYYIFCLFILFVSFSEVPQIEANMYDVVIYKTSAILRNLAFLIPPLLISKFNIRDNLPFFKKKKWWSNVFGFISIFFIVICFSNVITLFHSKDYQKRYEEFKNSLIDKEEVNNKTNTTKNSLIKVHYIDVGQGDSIFIELPNKKTMLIDAGESSKGKIVSNYISNLGYNKIDYIVGTHPHADHIGGLTYIINHLDIGKIYMPKMLSTSKTYETLLENILEKELKITTASAGVNIVSEENLNINIIAPNKEYNDLNNSSAVVKIIYGNIKFLFMGDAETKSENDITSDVSADVIKIGHHGSNTSSGQSFVNRVNPKYAIIMVGQNNQYKHPNQSIIDRWINSGAKVYRTDINGNIIVLSNGDSLDIKSTR